jgi:hypothetical protein
MRSLSAARGLLFALAVTAGTALAAPPAPPGATAGRAAIASMTVADLERGLMISPGASTIAAVKRHFPAEYPALLGEMLARIKASNGSFAAAHLIGAEVMRAFMLRHGAEVVNAPPALLNRINDRQLELMRGMARDQVSLCAEYATTGFTGRRPLPEPYLSQAAALGVLMVEASRAGADRAGEPGRGALTDADALAWYEAVQRIGTPQDVLDALGRPEGSPPASEDLSCRLGIAVYAAIDALPSEQAARVAAYFLNEGLKAQAAQ